MDKFKQVYKRLDKSRTFSDKSRQVWTRPDNSTQVWTILENGDFFILILKLKKKIWWLKLTFADELEFVLGGTRGGSDSFSKSCPDCTEKKNRGKH